MFSEQQLDDLLGAVADGSKLDWDALESGAPDEDAREYVQQLRLVAQLKQVHDSVPDETHASESLASLGGPELTIDAAETPGGLAWGRYSLVEKIGEGSFGEVYRAWDPHLERHIAIKILHPRLARAEPLGMRMLHEGRALARLRHPNIVSVLGVETHDGRIGLCMEHIRGRTLDQVMQTQAKLSAQEAAVFGQAVCRALAAVHAAGLVHRDVKARNVMREDAGRIVLMDFGAGRAVEENGQGGGGLAGTPIYMAPEVLAGEQASVRSDMYSVGVLLYYLVTGRHPIEGRTLDDVVSGHTKGDRKLLTEHRPDLPSQFVNVVEKALNPNPQARYASAASLMMDLVPVVQQADDDDSVLEFRGWANGSVRLSGRAHKLLQAGVALLSATGFVALLGLLNSYSYNRFFAISGDFASYSIGSMLRWGALSLIAPLMMTVLVTIVFFFVREILRFIRQLSPPFSRLHARVSQQISMTLVRMGLSSAPALAGLLIVSTVVFVGWAVFWRFAELVNVLNWPMSALSPEAVAILAPSNQQEHYAYRQVLSGAALALMIGWYFVIKRARSRKERLGPLVTCAGVLSGVVTVFFLNLPFRILFHTRAEKVVLQQSSCYRLAERDDSLLLFCPDDSKRATVVSKQGLTLRRLGEIESVFTRFSK